MPNLDGSDWLSIPHAPSWCPTRIRFRPKAEDSWVRWVPCLGVRAGCSEIVVGQGPRASNPRAYVDRDIGLAPVFVNGVPYLRLPRSFFREGLADENPRRIESIARLDGPILVDVFMDEFPKLAPPNLPPNSRPFCDMAFGLEGTRIVGAFQSGFRRLVDNSALPGTTRDVFWSASIDDPQRLAGTLLPPQTLGALGPQRVVLQGNTAYVNVGAHDDLPTTLPFRVSDAQPAVDPTLPGTAGRLDNPYPGPFDPPGVYVLGSDTPGPSPSENRGLFFLAPDGATTELLTPPKGRGVGDFKVDLAAEGATQALVWLDRHRSPAGIPSDTKLWTSPMGSPKAPLAPRCVVNLTPAWAFLTMTHGGLAGVSLEGNSNTAGSVRLVRLSDGAYWPLSSGSDFHFSHILWADETYVWAIASTHASAPSAHSTANALVRIERSTLGSALPGTPCTEPLTTPP